MDEKWWDALTKVAFNHGALIGRLKGLINSYHLDRKYGEEPTAEYIIKRLEEIVEGEEEKKDV